MQIVQTIIVSLFCGPIDRVFSLVDALALSPLLVCGELRLYHAEPVLPRPQRGARSRKVPGPLSTTGAWLSRTTEEEEG